MKLIWATPSAGAETVPSSDEFKTTSRGVENMEGTLRSTVTSSRLPRRGLYTFYDDVTLVAGGLSGWRATLHRSSPRLEHTQPCDIKSLRPRPRLWLIKGRGCYPTRTHARVHTSHHSLLLRSCSRHGGKGWCGLTRSSVSPFAHILCRARTRLSFEHRVTNRSAV